MEPLRHRVRESEPGVSDEYPRWRHSGASIFRPRHPLAAPGARVAQAPLGADTTDVDPPERPISGTRMGLGAPSSRRRHPADGCSRDPDSDPPRLDPWLANTSRRTTLAFGQREERLNPTEKSHGLPPVNSRVLPRTADQGARHNTHTEHRTSRKGREHRTVLPCSQWRPERAICAESLEGAEMSKEPEPVALNGQGVVTLPTTGTVAKHDRPNQAAFDRRVWPANRSPAMGAS